MTNITVGILGIVVFTVIVLIGLPIAPTMAAVGIAGYAICTNLKAAFSMATMDIFTQFSAYSLSVVAMYTWMGCLALRSGIGRQLFEFFEKLLGHLPGGLCIAGEAACAAFGAVCGSATATVSTIGSIGIPVMRENRYDASLSAASLAAGGGLGLLIPPSMGAIMYATCTGESISKQFIGGIGAGLLLMLMYMLVVYLRVRKHPELAPRTPRHSRKEVLESAKGGMVEVILIFLFSVVGLLVGWFTPTESGAVGACLVLLVCLLRKRLTWRSFLDSIFETVNTVGAIVFLIAAANVFGRFVAVSTLSNTVGRLIAASNLHPYVIMLIIYLVFLFGGCFIDGAALLLLTAPIFYPVVTGTFGFSGVWFGIICCLLGIAGSITPPVGVNVYVAKRLLPDVSLEKVFQSVWPFVLALLATVLLCSVFPQIITFLPSLVMS